MKKVLPSLLFIILLGLAYAFVLKPQEYNVPQDPQQLFEAFFQPEPDLIRLRCGPVCACEDDQAFYHAMQTYQLQQYEKAAEALTILLQDDLKDNLKSPVRFYLVNALLATDQNEEALTILSEIWPGNDYWSREKDWFYALTLIRLGDLPKAEDILQRYIDAGVGSHLEGASTLVLSLES